MEEDMEIDHIVDVPDTPDRVSARHDNRKYVGNPEKRRERVFPVANEMNDCRKYITVSSSEKSYPSKNVPIFRRAQTEKKFGLGITHSEGAEKMDKGKTISCNFPFKSSHHGPTPVFDLTEETRQLHHGSKANATADKKELKSSVGNSSLSFVTDSSNTSRNSFSGNIKLDNKTFPGPGITLDRGKSISLSNDSQSPLKSEKQVALPPCFSSPPKGRGHKRLVRNGCISPHNIATRAKQSAENKQSGHQIKDIEQSHVGHSVSYNTISPISVDNIVAEDRGCDRAKGKEVLIHPSSRGLDTRTVHTASSSPAIRYEEANGAGNAIRNSHNYSGGPGGWRTTHSEKNDDQHLYDVNRHHSRNYDVGRFAYKESRNITDIRDIGNRQSSKDGPSSLIIPEVYRSTATRPTAETLTKRQRKRGSTSRNRNEASNSSEIMFLSSSGESSGSSMNQKPDVDPDLVELFSAPRYSNRHYEDLDDNDNNSSDARARQVEADEILARELQEQLYHDDDFEGRGIDEHLAWELQHAEGLFHTSIDSHDISNPTLLPRANRQPRSRSNQNPSNRRRNVPQVSLSNRMSQLRTRTRSRPLAPAMSSRGRRSRFPLDMDLEMRIDILEALEDAMGDFNDMGVVDEFFQAHRDFNEDDYEMLLALDESNHQHTGASANQINSLPQSTIQTDNFSEACAICLETPAKGDTIRHLPCLHKFHKDCIDPWLRRKTSCPVCKSSVT